MNWALALAVYTGYVKVMGMKTGKVVFLPLLFLFLGEIYQRGDLSVYKFFFPPLTIEGLSHLFPVSGIQVIELLFV